MALRRSTGACVAALLATAACAKTPARPPRAAVSVAVTPVRRTSIPFTIEANGTVTPMATANVASQVDGIITDVLFTEGQEVTKAQVLFKIDARPYENAYQQARGVLARDLASQDYAQRAYDRYTEMYKEKVVTLDDYEARRASATSLQATVIADSATVATAKFNLDNTVIKAPIPGRTGGLLVRPGNLVRAGVGAPLVVINQVRPILARFAVPGSQLPVILQYGSRGGLPVAATPSAISATTAPPPGSAPTPLDASRAASPPSTSVDVAHDPPDPAARGSLFFIDNAVDTTTGTVQLKARFDNRNGQMWAGQFVAISLQLYVEDDALVVPAQCVVTGQRGTYVYVIDSANTAQQRPVTVERTTGGVSVIASGLSEGERVVTDGQSRLSNGAPVDLSGGRSGRGGRGGGRGGRGGRGRDSSANGGTDGRGRSGTP